MEMPTPQNDPKDNLQEIRQAPEKERLFNLPPLTFWTGIVLGLVFLAMLDGRFFDWAVDRLSFVPAAFGQQPGLLGYTLLSHALLHFGWPHILTNLAGLLAFGSGVERLYGRRHFFVILIGGIVLGAAGHWALFPTATIPMGGASAGISALFGAVLPVIVQRRELVIASAIFILVNLVIGTIGLPAQPGLSIAWQAHIFGFLFGEAAAFVIFQAIKRRGDVPEPQAVPEAAHEPANPWQSDREDPQA